MVRVCVLAVVWLPARRMSEAPRVDVESVSLDATGSPFVLWTEAGDRLREARFR